MLRALHFSDVHVDVSPLRIPLWDWRLKRVLGGANHALRRAPRFRRARRKLAALARFREQVGADLVLCTGDYTVLGTAPEMRAARLAVDGLTKAPAFATTPGNHDLYLPDGVAEARFEGAFGAFLESDLPGLAAGDGAWPLVRLIGDDAAVVALCSARPNPPFWRSSGVHGRPQLAAFYRALAHPELQRRFLFVLTHYAPRLADGQVDSALHRMVDAEPFLDACRGIARGTVLHGHVHDCFRLDLPGLAAPIHGAGSATQEKREGFWLFDVERAGGTARRGYWDGQAYRLTDEAHPLP
ncbi:MAG: metallophosphoesterase family protein [Sandaracinaceae bacterium]